MKLESGDLFERTKAEWIRAKMPLYETVWAEFIGHDGRGHPLPFPGLTPAQARSRRRFYQAHYSLALYAYLLDTTCDEISHAENSPYDFSGYIADVESFVKFITYVGHIYDMIEDITAALSHPDEVTSRFRPFNSVRSHAIHAARIPLQYDGVGMKIPPISGLNKADGEWHDDTTWDEVDPAKFQYLKDFCAEHRAAIFSAINEVFPRIRHAAHESFPGRIEEPATPVLVSYQTGSYCYTPGVSALNVGVGISGARQ